MTVLMVPLSGGEPAELIRFDASEEPEVFRLCATYRDQVIDVMAANYFEALCRVREIMALSGFSPVCYGASLDVYYPDGAAELGKGLYVYQLTMGQQATLIDTVETFSTGPDVCPTSVVEQKKYYQQWLLSLTR